MSEPKVAVTVTIDALPGCPVETAIEEAGRLAMMPGLITDKRTLKVILNYNGIELPLEPPYDVKVITQQYMLQAFARLEQEREQFVLPPKDVVEAAISERAHAQELARTREAGMLTRRLRDELLRTAPPITVGNSDVWNKMFKGEVGTPTSAMLSTASRWARLIQADRQTGKSIDDTVIETCLAIAIYGRDITSQMIGDMVDVLTRSTWIYDSELNEWYHRRVLYPSLLEA